MRPQMITMWRINSFATGSFIFVQKIMKGICFLRYITLPKIQAIGYQLDAPHLLLEIS